MQKKIKFIYEKKIQKTRRQKTVRFSFAEEKQTQVYISGNDEKIIILGVGKFKDMTWRKLHIIVRQLVLRAKSEKVRHFTLSFSDFIFPQLSYNDLELAEMIAINMEMANFEFVQYKTPPKEGWDFIETVYIEEVSQLAKSGFEKGQIIGQEINACRKLANTPGGEMTPKILASEAVNAAKNTRVAVKVLGKKEMSKLGMGAILGVAQGSIHEPKFIIMEYKGGKKTEKPIVLVGKGVTFDTGGLNLKPDGAILDMHLDMSGGAAVIHTIILAEKLKVKKNIVVLVPAVENMPSGESYRPGDILRSLSGITIEIRNTDAEGRVILADGLHYAKKYDPSLIIDVATLTGASIVALGQRASAIFTKEIKLEETFRDLGEQSGDYVWPLPLWDEYADEIVGTFGDVANLGKYGKGGGAITAAKFLQKFTEGYRWIHIDIAPRMTAIEGDHLAKGAVGAPIRLLIKYLESLRA